MKKKEKIFLEENFPITFLPQWDRSLQDRLNLGEDVSRYLASILSWASENSWVYAQLKLDHCFYFVVDASCPYFLGGGVGSKQ